ncbi:MAG: glutathione S-transferase family protein [Candidatus Binatia bacterium]
MITLYHSPRSRSVRPRWLLEEIGAAYDLVTLDFEKQEHKTAAHRQRHPHGQVPALVDGDLALIESAAICLHLADRFPAAQLAPPLGTPERGRYYQWVLYGIVTLEPPVLEVFMHTMRLPEAERSAAKAAAARERFAEIAQVLAEALGPNPFLLGERFSAADVVVGSTLAWASLFGLMDGMPALAAYVERLVQRPAYQRSQAD